ncbi:glycosyltransferase family 39 protein [Gloeocapsopsis crepidinum LEGE 06123]|uniref:Glycosyltransferase family 39 protein n=1 Tax=Gloeocapsopsis crepidinum LEGE 06123 TaxID=588587 RepID=A0ABR9UXZ7_9CHRO|nr:glycosyltransferase family 39 protein [Gloeocapsopsis crepidinum]MBE9193200.1 glycosyltransferase family 39 protein [Gloeocapsopsis crepidinum LEGE 06123]
MTNSKHFHYFALIAVILVGGLLRFWHLDLKSFWLDEIITALFSLGRNYNDVPLDVVFPVEGLSQIFSFKAALSCPQIAANLATQSVHPPLFFCLLHSWVQTAFVGIEDWGLVWSLRSLPALIGVAAIAAIYWLNAIAFSRSAGLIAAAFMAVSPFAVYLSQEARHYTLPILLITLSLVGLTQIQKDLLQQKLRYFTWLGWIAVNCLGFYTHYFFILAFVAQVVTLLALMYSRRRSLPRYSFLAIAASILVVVASFIPWLLAMLSHANRSETTWLSQSNPIAPIYQTLASWVLMLIALPVENQPWWIAIVVALVMIVFSIWSTQLIFRGLKQLWHSPKTHLSTKILLSFTIIVLLEMFVIVYFLGRDITIAPRYNFVYYPSFCALVGASLAVQNFKLKLPNAKYIVISFGLISSIFVVNNLAFQKPFNPKLVAQNMNLEPTIPLMMVVGYETYQDVALGLSFALALEKIRVNDSTNLAFLSRSPGYESVWQKLSTSPLPEATRVNLWIVAPGLKRRAYPPQLTLSNKQCDIDTTQHYRIGIPYQLYRCS